MTMTEIIARIDTPEFAAAIAKEQDNEKLAQLFREHGIELTAEQIAQAKAEAAREELNAEDLDMVSGGGGFKWRYLNPIYWVGRALGYLVTTSNC